MKKKYIVVIYLSGILIFVFGFKTSVEKFHAYTTSFDTAASILKFQKSNALILMY